MSKVQCHSCKEYGHYAYQCVKVNVVTLPGIGTDKKKPPVMKQGKIGTREHLWYMDSGADMCFIAEDLLPDNYTDCPPVHAKGAMHQEGRMCPTVLFDAVIDGKKTTMFAAVAPSSMLPYPAIVGCNGAGLHIQWDVKVSTQSEKTPTSKVEQQADGEAGEASSQVLEESAEDPELAEETTTVQVHAEDSAGSDGLQQTNQHLPATPPQEQLTLGT